MNFYKIRGKPVNKLNEILNRFFPLLITSGLITGILLGDRVDTLQVFVPFVFAFVTFIGSLNMNFRSFKETLMTPFPILTILLVLRVISPLWALLVGNIVFQGDAYTITGILLFALLPTGINSAVWAMMYKGNISLALTVILVDTLFSPFILPLSLTLLTGATIEMEVGGLMTSLTQMVVIPSVIGMLVNQVTKGNVSKTWSPRLSPFAKLGLVSVVIVNGGMVSPYFETIDAKLLLIMATIFFLSLSGYVIAWSISKLFKFKHEDLVTNVFSGGMRNVSVGIVIAVAHFPSQVAVPVITAILFQQTINGIIGVFLNKRAKKLEDASIECDSRIEEEVAKLSYAKGKVME